MTLYRNELQKYLVDELGLKAENISIMDGKNDQSEQMNQIRNFVTQGFDVMIINLVQASSATKQVSRLFTSTVSRMLRESRLGLTTASKLLM